jgi:tetratricopeptide (TPR) repeat protein
MANPRSSRSGNKKDYTPENFQEIIKELNDDFARKERDALLKTYKRYESEYRSYSDLLGQCKTLKDIHDLLKNMLSKHQNSHLNKKLCPNTPILNQLITKLSLLGYIDYAKEMFNIAVKQNLANAVTYNSMIAGIANSADPNIDEAMDLLQKAEELKCANDRTYSQTILVIANSKNPNVDTALCLLGKAETLGHANNFTYNNMLLAIANSDDPNVDLALKVLENAIKSEQVDNLTYNNVILVIARNKEPNTNLAVALLQKAQYFDARTYANTILAIANSETPNVTAVLTLLEEAKEYGCVDEFVYANAMLVIANSKTPDITKVSALLQEATEKGFNGLPLYNNAFDAIAKSDSPNKVEVARNLLTKIMDEEIFNFPPIRNNAEIDLHRLSFGTVYFWLNEELPKLSENTSIILICGKGLHSKKDEEIHPVKQAVLKVLQENRARISADSSEEKEEASGRIHMTWHPQNRHSQQFFTSVIREEKKENKDRKKLDPAARPFIPGGNKSS